MRPATALLRPAGRTPTRAAARRPAVVLATVLTAVLTGCSAGTSGERPADSGPAGATAAGFHGVEPAGEVPSRASFVLRDTAGQRYDFRVRTAGRPTLLYFGFTSCADECPTAMADIAGALRKTSSDLRGKTRVVFVTTDPARDSPQVLRRWLDRFSTEYVGLVGTPAQVGAAQRAVGLKPADRSGPQPTLPGRPDSHAHEQGTAPHVHDGPLGYGVDHADVIFAFDADDRLPVLYPGGVRPSDLAADLPLLASGEAS